MRIRRITLLFFVGLLIIGLSSVVAVPYLHHLKYPQDDRALTKALEIPPAYLEMDRRVDELGSPDQIRTEADAKAYVEALWKRWGYDPNETYPHLAEFQEQLARAEYAAVRDPSKLIPESKVAETFNKLMDEWQTPWWTRISVSELHAFRYTPATTTYPRSVARLPDQTIAPSCRPTEAALLIYLLDYNAPMLPEIREQVRNGRFPWSLLKQMKELVSKPAPSEFPPRTPPERQRREAQYMACRDKHFASHPFNFEAAANEIFAQLGIPKN